MRTFNTHYIGGKHVESHGQETLDLISPSTRSMVGRVTLGDETDAREAIKAAAGAFETYSTSTLDERRDYLQSLHDAIAARTPDHIAAVIEEYGGTQGMAAGTVGGAALTYLNAKALLDDVPFTRSYGVTRVSLKPVGVAGLITPWNASLLLISQKIAPAIAAGCTVVLKPSELSALQTRVMVECFDAAGLPPGLINVVNGRGEVVGTELTTNPAVAKISFTGSTAVGKTVVRNAAETMKRVTLELGGKSATIILDDADLDRAIPFALGAGFMNSGQACIAGTRLLVPASRLDEIKTALRAAVAQMKVGLPSEPDTVVGPMVSEKQYERVQSYIGQGIDEGAEVLIGGPGHPDGLESGYFVKPTVFTGVTNHMTIAREEIFGPVLSVISYDSVAEAIDIANDSSYGLFGYIATSDVERGKRVADRIQAGGIWVNDLFDFYAEPNAPIGGFKQSGLGREFGVAGIEEYLEIQSVFAH